MTSRQYRFVLVAIFLLFSLLLVACERPMPSNDDISATAVTTGPDSSVDPGSGEEDTETYPGPPVPEADATLEGDSADESYPVGEEEEVSSADLIQPADESQASEGYPAAEGEVAGEEESSAEADNSDVGEVSSEDEAAPEGEATSEGETSTEGEGTGEGETASAGDVPVEGGRTHIVAPGENLFRISSQYGISWIALAEANNLTDPNDLTVGQELIIPDASSAESTEAVETTEDTQTIESTEDSETTAVEESTADESAEIIYVVKSGDNLYRISLKFGVSMMEIARLNGIADFNQVNAGQELIIPAVETTDGGTEEVSHEVQEGETVFSIAFQHGIAWTKLVEANDISSPFTLELGQVLVIPSSE